VCELRRVCAEATGRLRLDLTDLVSLDAVGVDMLRRLRDDGAAIVGVAEYLKQKLGPSPRHSRSRREPPTKASGERGL
jgi:hypothetical protein